MMQDKTTINGQLQHIADMLLLNGTLTNCPGLVHGKTGIAIFFFHYARHTGKELHKDYAMDLIGEIQAQIHNNSPADYEKGIAGIGVGIDYLIRNDFLKPDENVFEDFDARMYRAVMYDPWPDFSLYDGLTGYGRYWMMRLGQPSSTRQAQECLSRIISLIGERIQEIDIKEQSDVYCFLHDLHQIPEYGSCIKILMEQGGKLWQSNGICNFPRLGASGVGNIIRQYQQNRYFDMPVTSEFDLVLKQLPDTDLEKRPEKLGLLGGYAGEGLCRMAVFEPQNISWMQLL